jgi:hypothetical protein
MEYPIGPHTVRIDDDTISIVVVGDCLTEHVVEILGHIEGIGGGRGKFYILADVGRLKNIPPDARRVAGAWRSNGRAGGIAILGATVLSRTLVMLVSRASSLLYSSAKRGEMNFFDTEEAARAWLRSRRSAFLLRQSRG